MSSKGFQKILVIAIRQPIINLKCISFILMWLWYDTVLKTFYVFKCENNLYEPYIFMFQGDGRNGCLARLSRYSDQLSRSQLNRRQSENQLTKIYLLKVKFFAKDIIIVIFNLYLVFEFSGS